MFENGDDILTTKAGTSLYYSPEMCQGIQFHGRPADIWACGIVLYKMIMKKMPFDQNDLKGLFQSIMNQEPDYSKI